MRVFGAMQQKTVDIQIDAFTIEVVQCNKF